MLEISPFVLSNGYFSFTVEPIILGTTIIEIADGSFIFNSTPIFTSNPPPGGFNFDSVEKLNMAIL